MPHYSADANSAGISNDPSRNVIAIHAKFRAAETSYTKDGNIYCAGEPADRIYEVVRGAVRSCKLLSDGRRQICAFHLPNDVFGLEFGTNYRFTAEAIVDTTVRMVRRHSLEYVATTNVGVARDLLRMAATTLRHAEDHLLLLGRQLALERVAAFLLEMDRRLEGTSMIALPMTRLDIADYLGVRLETVFARAVSFARSGRSRIFENKSAANRVAEPRTTAEAKFVRRGTQIGGATRSLPGNHQLIERRLLPATL